MVNINPCAVFGTLVAFTGTILIAVGASLPEFVDVFIVRLESEVDASTPVGGVGVFTSFYDAGLVDPAIIEASGFPNDSFEEPSSEFRLLFPAQQNFIVQILPVNDELADALGEATGNVAIATAIKDLLAPMNERVFDDCETYWTDTTDDLDALFAFLQGTVVPGAVGVLSETFRSSFEENIKTVSTLLGLANRAQNPAGQLLLGALTNIFNGLAVTAGCETVGTNGFAGTFDAVSDACVGAAVDATIAANGAASPATAGLLTFIKGFFNTGNAVCTGLTFTACVDTISFNLDDISGVVPVSFNGGAGVVTPCNYFAADCSAVNKLTFLQNMAGLLNENGQSGAAAAIGIYLQAATNGAFSGLAVSAADTIGATTFGNPAPGGEALPASFAGDFNSCIFPNIFFLVQTGQAVFNSATCAFEDYFGRVGQLIQISADASVPGSEDQISLLTTLALVEEIGGLYDACNEGQAAQGDPNPNTIACPTLFVFGTLEGLYGDDMSIADIDGSAIAACEEDNVDKEKIEQAQVSIIISFIFYGLAVICASLGFLLPVAVYAFSCAGISSFLAGVLTLGALLIVQSAPVYDGVGDPLNGDFDPEVDDINDLDFEDFLTEGTSALLAVLAFILMFVAGVSFISAVGIETCANKKLQENEEGEDKEEKEVVAATKAVEVEEEEAVAVEGGGKVTI